jgi:hypothetical protein
MANGTIIVPLLSLAGTPHLLLGVAVEMDFYGL